METWRTAVVDSTTQHVGRTLVASGRVVRQGRTKAAESFLHWHEVV